MSIPSAFPRHMVAAHRPMPGNEILHHTSKHMPWVGHGICSRRAFIEYEFRPVLCLLQGFLKNPLFPPEFQDFFLHLRHVPSWFDFPEHGTSSSNYRTLTYKNLPPRKSGREIQLSRYHPNWLLMATHS